MSTITANFHRVTTATAEAQKAESCQWLQLSFKDSDNGRFALALFCDSPEELLKSMLPQVAAPTFKDGIEAAAKYLEKKADDYDAEHGSTDPETGTREYPGRGAGLDYHSNLIELAEEIRALAA